MAAVVEAKQQPSPMDGVREVVAARKAANEPVKSLPVTVVSRRAH